MVQKQKINLPFLLKDLLNKYKAKYNKNYHLITIKTSINQNYLSEALLIYF